jgi:hypothetical protein
VLVSELNTAGNVSITAAQGRLIDNNDTPTTKRTNITAADVKLKADSIEQRPVDFFTGLPDALEVSVSGNLSVSVQQFAALQGSIAGTDLLAAETLFLMSAGNLGFSTVNPSVTNLALLADVDGNNNGTLFFSTPVAVSGDLRISGADIDAGQHRSSAAGSRWQRAGPGIHFRHRQPEIAGRRSHPCRRQNLHRLRRRACLERRHSHQRRH